MSAFHIPSPACDWAVSSGLQPYAAAIAAMESRAAAIASGGQNELVWLLEHESVYTAGVSAKPAELLDSGRFPVFRSGRGGRYSWHGPGQRVVYLMLDLNRRGRDLRAFVAEIENWIMESLEHLHISSVRLPGRVGLWVPRQEDGADKIAAIGLKLRKWVSFHGVSINVSPELSAYDGIVPCGNAPPFFGVTSLQELGLQTGMSEFDEVLRKHFISRFGAVRSAAPPSLLSD